MKFPDVELATEYTRSYPGIQVTPIVAKQARDSSVQRFLWEGIEDKSVEIEEQKNSNVPNVTLINHSTERFLGYRGSIIRGGGQNRHLVHSFVVPEKSHIDIPVQCIQHGRWNPHQSNKFSTKSGDITSSSIRFQNKSQQETWRSIRETTTLSGTISMTEDFTVLRDCLVGTPEEMETATSSLAATDSKTHEQRQKSRDRAQKILSDLEQPLPNQVGVYVTVVDPMEWKQGKVTLIYCVEIFASPQLYGKAHKDIISSFAVDIALLPEGDPRLEPIAMDEGKFKQLLKEIEGGKWKEDRNIGKEKRFELKSPSPQPFGESIVLENDLVHLMYSSAL